MAWLELDYELCQNIAIYRDLTSSPLTPNSTKLIATLPCTAVEYTDTNVTGGTTYYYSLFIIDDLGVYSDPLSGSFTAPTTISTTSSSGGGGGGGGSKPVSSIVYIPAVSATPIPGCGSRTTGFSTITGQSCAGNSSTTATTYNFGTVTLRNGSRGEAVKELQRFLNAKLNLGLVVDGKLGPKTIAVIKQWQMNNGLVVDGLVGPKTKAKMNALTQ